MLDGSFYLRNSITELKDKQDKSCLSELERLQKIIKQDVPGIRKDIFLAVNERQAFINGFNKMLNETANVNEHQNERIQKLRNEAAIRLEEIEKIKYKELIFFPKISKEVIANDKDEFKDSFSKFNSGECFWIDDCQSIHFEEKRNSSGLYTYAGIQIIAQHRNSLRDLLQIQYPREPNNFHTRIVRVELSVIEYNSPVIDEDGNYIEDDNGNIPNTIKRKLQYECLLDYNQMLGYAETEGKKAAIKAILMENIPFEHAFE